MISRSICFVDARVRNVLEAVSDRVELLGPLRSLIGVCDHAQDEDQDWNNAADICKDSSDKCIIRFICFFDESISDAVDGEKWADYLDPSPGLTHKQGVDHL